MRRAPANGGKCRREESTTGEDPREAALRELREETGVRSARIIGETSDWLTYDLPPELVGVAWGGKYRGQRQKWFAARFTGLDEEIDIAPPGHEQEFDAWKWTPIAALVDEIVPFKREVYRAVVAELGGLAKAGRVSGGDLWPTAAVSSHPCHRGVLSQDRERLIADDARGEGLRQVALRRAPTELVRRHR